MIKVKGEDELRPVLAAICETPNEDRIAQQANYLALTVLLTKAAEFNVGRMEGKTKALISLRQLYEKVDDTIDHICQMRTESRQMLEKSLTLDQATDKWEILDALAKLASASAAAHRAMSKRPYSPGPTTKPQKSASLRVARDAYRIFHELTGKQPGRLVRDGKEDGQFLAFLSQIFDVCNIEGSPAVAARKVIMENKPAASE